MELLLERRRMMFTRPIEQESPYDEFGYIKSGKVFHLDGIVKGDVNNAWTDLVGGVSFALNAAATSETNAIVMDGTDGLQTSSSVPYAFSDSTIEVCAERLGSESYGVVFFNKEAGLVSFIYSGNNKVVTGQVSKPSRFTLDTNAGKNTYSCTPTKVVKNGVDYTTASSEGWASKGYVCIGGRGSGSSFDYKCNVRIFSIRIYDKILTDEEIANNQSVDNTRFNLGL